MKKKLILFFLIIIGIISAYCVGQDLIKSKTKKSYVSEQQCVELDGDLVVCGTRASGVLIEFSKAIFLVTQMAVTRVNDYACGEKECLNKIERTEKYEKKVKIKEKIDYCIQQIEHMLMSLNALIASLDE
jgi:hypothetical protein